MPYDKFLSGPDVDALESMVDRYSLGHVVQALAQITEEKQEHIRETWGDESGVKLYRAGAIALQRAEKRLTAIGL